jgi:hypothetical protein
MAQALFPDSNGVLYPAWDLSNTGSGLTESAALLIDATGEKAAFIGPVIFGGDRTTSRAIRKVSFKFGAVTKAGGSGLTLSLQDVSAAAAFVPDEVQDQTVAIAAAGVTTQTAYTTGNLSADRTVNYGDMVAVVIEFDGGGRLGADSFVISSLANVQQSRTSGTLKTGGTWAQQVRRPLLHFEFADGTFGTMEGALPASALGSVAFNSGSAADEIAMGVQFPFEVVCLGADVLALAAGTSSDFDIVLYEGTTARRTCSVDAMQLPTATNAAHWVALWAPYTIPANTLFRIALKPTTANSVTMYYRDVAAAALLDIAFGGQNFCYASRVDAGAWTDVTTRQPLNWSVRIASVPNDVGGSGGGLLSPNLHGNRMA